MLRLFSTFVLFCAAVLGQNPVAGALSIRGDLLMDSAEGMASVNKVAPLECTGCNPEFSNGSSNIDIWWGWPGSGIIISVDDYGSSSGSCKPTDCTPDRKCKFRIDIKVWGATYPILLRATSPGGTVTYIEIYDLAYDYPRSIETPGGDFTECGKSLTYTVSGIINGIWDQIEIPVTCSACKTN